MRLTPAALLIGMLVVTTVGVGRVGSATVSVKSGFFFGRDVRQARSVVYVLDLSGSMSEHSGSVVEQAGTSAVATAVGGVTGGFLGRSAGNAIEDRIARLNQKIEKIKLHLIASIAGLPDGATFNVILFSDGVQKIAPGMIVANTGTKVLVSAFVDHLKEGGGTNMYAAMEAAMHMPTSEIILLTDGLPTSSSPEAILDLVDRANQGRFTVSTVGVGGDQAHEFLAALALANGGTYGSYD